MPRFRWDIAFEEEALSRRNPWAVRRHAGLTVLRAFVPELCFLLVLPWGLIYWIIDLHVRTTGTHADAWAYWSARVAARFTFVGFLTFVNILFICYVAISAVGSSTSPSRRGVALWCGYAASLVLLGVIHVTLGRWRSFVINPPPHLHRALLVGAVRAGHAELVDEMIAQGEPLRGRGDGGPLALLHHALAGPDPVKMIGFLVSRGADVNEPDISGVTALYYVCRRPVIDRVVYVERPDRHATIAALLEAGADVNLPGPQKTTPLHEAVVWASEETVKLLLEHGARVRAADSNGVTPLDIAYEKRPELVRLLWARLADEPPTTAPDSHD